MSVLALRSLSSYALWAFIGLLGFGLFLVTGCRNPATGSSVQRFEFSSPHMGTLFKITLYASNQISAEDAAEAAFRRVAALENVMSDYQADSELMLLCQKPPNQAVPVSADLFDVLRRAHNGAEQTKGAFDPTIGPFVRLWRFSRKRGVLPRPEELEQARQAIGYEKVRLNERARTVTLLVPNMRLDLGGIGKGFAADEALKVLRGRGVKSALVAASGDIAIGDSPPGKPGWRIDIASAGSPNRQPFTLLLHNAGVSTSGDTEQAIEIGGVRYSHIVDPATGLGLTNSVQVTVVAPDATTSDYLATGVSVLGQERGVSLINSVPKTAGMISNREGGTVCSRRWAGMVSEDRAASPVAEP